MDIPNDLIYKDVELVHEFDKANQEMIRFSFVFDLSHSKPKDKYKWDRGYELRTVSGVHVYCDGCLARHAEVTVKLSQNINCSNEELKKVYVGTLMKAFNGQIPEKVCVITNLDQDPVAMGNIETNQFMYIEGKPRLVSKEDVLKSVLAYIY